MEFRLTEEQERFRQEVVDFLEEEIRNGSFVPQCDAWLTHHSKEFSRKLSERGWLGMGWPKEYGGQGKTHLDRLILTEQLLRFGAPAAAHWIGERQIGPSIIAYGTEEQKREILPKILSAEISFGLGMSEPDAGSDLASLKTRATPDGDDFIVDGQKIWSSGAHVFTYLYTVVRTDSDVPKHKGISELLIDLKSPGITVNPIQDLTGDKHFNEVFFDNVRVPRKNMLGQMNRGWYQVTPQLDYERSGIERIMSNYPLFTALIDYVKNTKRHGRYLSEDPLIRNKLARLRTDFEVGRLMVYRVAWILSQERVPNFETAMAKAYCSEFQQRLARTAMEILGLHGQLMPQSKWVPAAGHGAKSYLFSPGYTLQGGTSEILRGIIAMRGLGLPSGR